MLTPSEIIQRYSKNGKAKALAPAWKMLLLGGLGGIMTAFGAALSNVGAHGFDNPSAVRMISGVLFAFAIGSVIVLGGELFTGNAMLVIPILDRKMKPLDAIQNFVFVYTGNFLGAVLVALACYVSGHLGMSGGQLALYTMQVAVNKCTLSFSEALMSGVLCNLLICIGVLVSVGAGDVPGKIMGAFLPVAIFVVCGFENAVANMYYIPAGLLSALSHAGQSGLELSNLTLSRFLLGNLLPVTLGNLLAGAALGLALWVCHGKQRQTAKEPAPFVADAIPWQQTQMEM